MKKQKTVIKTCQVNPRHIWAADIPYFPYCNCSTEARIYHANKQQDSKKKNETRN